MIAAAAVQKPKALRRGSRFAVIAPASPANSDRIAAGQKELERLGFSVALPAKFHPDGYFAAAADERRSEFLNALHDSSNADALIATRGGYGSVYLLDGELICHEKQVRDEKPACDKEPGRDEELACNEKLTRDEKLICHPERSEGSAFSLSQTLPTIKPLVGFSDITTLQIYLWQTHRWISIYGPMLAAGLDHGPGAPGGYDETSFRNALTKTSGTWTIPLQGEPIGSASSEGSLSSGGSRSTESPFFCEGTLLGGAMTLVEATIGTPWELNTEDAILILEDRAMKPYQVDRVLMHLKHAGKFSRIRGLILGDFPECEPPIAGSPSVRDVCARILSPLGFPIVYGAPIGHTVRPMLTIPLGIRARLNAENSGTLEILEPAVIA